MPLLSWFAHHRIWALGAGIAVLIAAVAVGVWFLVLRSPGTQVDLRQALRLYRHDQQDPPAVDGSMLPAPGVYNYRTSGYERLSVGGISRSFPSSSEMVVTDTACATVRWVPFQQHMEGLVECSGRNGAVGMVSALSDEEIAGVRTTEVIHCPAGPTSCPAPGAGTTVVGHLPRREPGGRLRRPSARLVHRRRTGTARASPAHAAHPLVPGEESGSNPPTTGCPRPPV